MKARIVATGSYVPEKVLSNADLEKIVDTSDEWIRSRTGMQERRIAADDQAASDMGLLAAKKALAQANMEPSEIDLIITMTMTPDYLTPSTAAVIQAKLGMDKVAAFDVSAACSGFVYGLSVAKAYIESGMAKKILLVATEKMSPFIDYTDRNTCVLFGDGAAAAIITGQGEGFIIETINLGADGCQADLIIIPAGGSKEPITAETLEHRDQYVKMEGKETFKHAVRRMTAAANESLSQLNLTENDISWVVPHQANIRIIDAIIKTLKVSPDRVWKTIHKYGNTSGSSVAIALDELIQSKPIEIGENILLVVFGAGLTWGSTILKKGR